jgi:hypothetical protein
MTPEEKYWADRRAKEEREEAARREQEQRNQQMGFFSQLWDRFGIFELILMALVVGGLYLAAKANPEFVQSLVEKLPDSWQETVSGFLSWAGIDVDMKAALEKKPVAEFQKQLQEQLGLDEAAAKTLIPDDNAKKALIQLVSDANAERDAAGTITKAGKVNLNTLMNDKTVYELLKQKPDMVQALAAKVGGDKPLTDNAQKIVASLKTIVADGRMDVLLKGDKLNETLTLLEKINPKLSRALVKPLIDSGMTADGHSTPALRALFTSLLTVDSEGKLPSTPAQLNAALEAYRTANPAAATAIVQAVVQPTNTATPTTEQEKLLRQFVQNNGGKAFAAFRAALGNDDNKVIAVGMALNSDDELLQIKTALEHRAALEAYIKASDPKTLPEAMLEAKAGLDMVKPEATKPLLAILGKFENAGELHNLMDLYSRDKKGSIDTKNLIEQLLTNPTARATLVKAGPEQVVAFARVQDATLPASFTAANMLAVLKAAQTIGENPKMSDERVRRDTVSVLKTMADAVYSGNLNLIGKLSPEEFTAFFDEPKNAKALKDLLVATKSSLPEEQAKTAQALLDHWELIEKLSRDKKGAQLILSNIASAKKPDADSCKKPGLSAAEKAWLEYVEGKDGILMKDNIIAKEIEGIEQLVAALGKARCVSVVTSDTYQRPVTPPAAASRPQLRTAGH